jgi:hypothetical protein
MTLSVQLAFDGTLQRSEIGVERSVILCLPAVWMSLDMGSRGGAQLASSLVPHDRKRISDGEAESGSRPERVAVGPLAMMFGGISGLTVDNLMPKRMNGGRSEQLQKKTVPWQILSPARQSFLLHRMTSFPYFPSFNALVSASS